MAENSIELVNYSDKSISLFGNTKKIKQKLKNLGGKYNKNLIDPRNGNKTPGWIFSIKKKDLILRELSLDIQVKSNKFIEKPEKNIVKSQKNIEKPGKNIEKPQKNIIKQNKELSGLNIALEEGLSKELALKYNIYYVKKIKIQETGRSSVLRDSSRSKVYDAENKFRTKYPDTIEMISEKEAINFFNEVINSEIYKELSNNNFPRLIIKDILRNPKLRGKNISGQATQNYVELSRDCGLKKATILHELSHTCGNPHHDIKFREDQLKLVKEFFGNKYYTELNRCYKNNKLKTKVIDKILEPQEWLKNYEKITNARSNLKK